MSLNAFVTLLTTDAYLPGALVTLQSVLEAEGSDPSIPFETVCLVTPATVSVESIKALRRNFSLVVGVEELRSGSKDNLALLGRQDLASTLTKLQLFRLIQFKKIIFLDADTLCLSPLSHLFSLEATFSAAPDAGWPDCFNSGMFVCTPSAETFDGLLKMASERGSWDGGDQGLLNDYFPNWNRLSFTYNVTPSAYYTYAPAYERYGDSIKVVHFIGQDKPWYQAGSRSHPSTSTSSTQKQPQQPPKHDYQYLLDRWFAVYTRYFGNSSPTTFTFPTLQAVWDASPKSGHSRAAYTPPSLEELKKQFQGITTSQSSSSRLPISSSSVARSIEGHYVSMPLQAGRPDLLGARIFIPIAKVEPEQTPEQAVIDPATASSPSLPPMHVVAPTPIRPEAQGTPSIAVHHSSSPDHHHESADSAAASTRSWSPQHVSWDPARTEPPKNDRPQMEAGFNYHSENVWDEPENSSSQRTFFRPPSTYGSIPEITHQNYDSVTRASPDQSKLKPIFPWEFNNSGNGSGVRLAFNNNGTVGASPAYKPTRVFPPELNRKPKLTPTRPAPPPPTSSSTGTSPNHSRSHTPQQHQIHHHQVPHQGYDQQNSGGGTSHVQAPTPVVTDFAHLSSAYTNAWDDVAGIRNYAKGLSGSSSSKKSSSTSNSARRNGSHHHSSSSPSALAHSQLHHSHQNHSSVSSQAGSATTFTAHPSTASSSASSSSSTPLAHQSRSSSSLHGQGGSGSSISSAASSRSSEHHLHQQQQQQQYTRQRNLSTGSGYDTGGEASSRDGDDEDEDDEVDARHNATAAKNQGTRSGSGAYTTSTSINNSSRFATSRTSSSETITSLLSPSSSTRSDNTRLPDTSAGTYEPKRVSRVFDPSTATDVIRKEGLEALHRFVRSMEAKGAAAAGANANGQTQPNANAAGQ